MLEYLFYAFIAIVIVNSGYYFFFGTFLFSKIEKPPRQEIPVSLIICAKNEAENLQQNLPYFLDQAYANYEIVLINDSSSDTTQEVMEFYQQKDSRIRIVNVENNERFWGNKKYALTLGIKAAKYPYLLFTDADCIPVSNNWISEMSAHFVSGKELVLGYGKYKRIERSFLNKLIRFETLLTAIQYFSFAHIGKAYMGVGRNLAYSSSLFYHNNGFISHMNIRSGDDDLFVNEVANKHNTALAITPESFTESTPKQSWKAWFLQKRRHVSTAKKYKLSHKVSLGLFYLSQLLFWVMAVCLLSTGFQWHIVLGLFFFRLFLGYIVFYKSSVLFQEKGLWWLFPIQELILICFQFSIFITNSISKPVDWK